MNVNPREWDTLVNELEATQAALKEAERERDEARRVNAEALALVRCENCDAAKAQLTRVRGALANIRDNGGGWGESTSAEVARVALAE